MSKNYTFNTKTLVQPLMECIATGLVPFVHGSPGIGKSDIMRMIAKSLNLLLIDFRLAQCDPTDLNGFPTRTVDGRRMEWVPPTAATMPLTDDPMPINPETGKHYDGWLLFFDEANAAPAATQAAAYKVILDRMVGHYTLHPMVRMAAAGNLVTDRAVTNRLSTALKSRMVHFTLEPDPESFDEYMLAQNWDDRVLAFLRFRPALLHNFDPSSAEDTFPCPRTWSFVNRYLNAIYPIDTSGDKIPAAVLSSMVGDGAATEFSAFVEMMSKCPSIIEIERDAKGVKVPTEPSMRFAVSTMVGRKLTNKNIVKVIDYIERLGVEFQVLCMRTAMVEHPEIKRTEQFQKWAMARKLDIFGK